MSKIRHMDMLADLYENSIQDMVGTMQTGRGDRQELGVVSWNEGGKKRKEDPTAWDVIYLTDS